MTAEAAMTNLMMMYREYAEHYTCDEETDQTIIMALVALKEYEQNKPVKIVNGDCTYTQLLAKDLPREGIV